MSVDPARCLFVDRRSSIVDLDVAA